MPLVIGILKDNARALAAQRELECGLAQRLQRSRFGPVIREHLPQAADGVDDIALAAQSGRDAAIQNRLDADVMQQIRFKFAV